MRTVGRRGKNVNLREELELGRSSGEGGVNIFSHGKRGGVGGVFRQQLGVKVGKGGGLGEGVSGARRLPWGAVVGTVANCIGFLWADFGVVGVATKKGKRGLRGARGMKQTLRSSEVGALQLEDGGGLSVDTKRKRLGVKIFRFRCRG